MPSRHLASPRIRRSAFTLIEVLVVMGIIILLVALALPAFSFITGSRSTEAASNQIGGALGVAREQAIGLQKMCGVMFFIEPTSDNVQMTLVQQADRPVAPEVDNVNVDVYLDLVKDAEFVKLPVGVGVQTVTNAMIGTPANRDRYIGFNTAGIGSAATAHNTTPGQPGGPIKTMVGGVILFDGQGQLIAQRYALRTRINSTTPSLMGALLMFDSDASIADANSIAHAPVDYIPVSAATYSANIANAPVSQLGFVLFDASAFLTKGFTLGDYRADPAANTLSTEDGTTAADMPTSEEGWLDANGVPTMINRYNGTLVRGE